MNPNLPFEGATGRGLRIAVIDSGVHAGHPHISGVAGGVSVNAEGAIEEDSFSDSLGHGTAVMAAIQEKAPDAEYFAVKLFHASLRTTSTALLCALQWAIGQRMDVINLSLGTRKPDYAARFAAVAGQAAEAGVMLVAAYEADGAPCYPGSLPDVIGVGLDWECDRNRYRWSEVGGSTVFYASGFPRSISGVPRESNLQGISFAVANMSGFVLRAGESARASGETPLSPPAIRQVLVNEVCVSAENAS
jgi:Subtilase family